jgi:preprotein translocase subunit SecE
MNKAVTFLKEVRVELSKVVWPTRSQTIRLTMMVISVTVLVGVFIAGVDFVLAKASTYLYGR